MAENQTQLVLAQNQYAFIQDSTKGTVQIYVGPHAIPLSQTDRPVVYDRATDHYKAVSLDNAIRQNPVVGEGEYVVLENPAFNGEARLHTPLKSGEQPSTLLMGRKINIPGPITFPLWPGQSATTIPGHHLRSNQYLVVRVYNAEEANRNATPLLRLTAGLEPPRPVGDTPLPPLPAFTPGQLLVIKGTEASFFIPPTGFEVLVEDGKNSVREALTLERLEYAILLDEDGNKRYERGPQVVFPEATERFVTRDEEKDGQKSKSRKFKAIELNDQMGLYIKVIADYEEEVPALSLAREPRDGEVPMPLPPDHRYEGVKALRAYRTGEELFITGVEQRIYYPRPEHALIGYDDPKSGFKRERYYGVTIPKGEGRYVLNKTAGAIELVQGPTIFLPDPRNQVIVRRVLDDKTVDLWYPGNVEAKAFNASLRALSDEAGTILADSAVQAAAADVSRSMNRMTVSNASYSVQRGLGAALPEFSRGGKFTPPPMLTLSNKYDGVPAIAVWTGYAVQVVNRGGARRVVVGPANVLLEYDETLEAMTLSTGRPKNTDNLLRAVYLRVDHNLVSDEVTVQTSDLVDVKIKVSYRVNFLREHQQRWFAVENYVKYLCDHMRSMLKAAAKRLTVRQLIDDSAGMVRDAVLGERPEEAAGGEAAQLKRHRFFPENGMDVYDVETLGLDIPDKTVANLLVTAQTGAVQRAINLASNEQALIDQRRGTAIAVEMADLNAQILQHNYAVQRANDAAKAETTLAAVEAEYAESKRSAELQAEEGALRRGAELDAQTALADIAAAELARRKAMADQDAAERQCVTDMFVKRMAAITPQLTKVLQDLGDKRMLTDLGRALAPLALHEQQGLGQTMERVFKGTALEPLLRNMQAHALATGDEDDDA